MKKNIDEWINPDENIPQEIINEANETILKQRISNNLVLVDQIWLREKKPIYGITFIIQKIDK